MDYNKFWNKQIRSIKTEFLPQIEDKIAIAIRKKGMKESVLKDIKFNLLTLFMLDFYSDYYSDSFFENMLQIYLAGHFPCGWNEKDGFIVY